MLEKEVGVIFTGLDIVIHLNKYEPVGISKNSNDNQKTRRPKDSIQTLMKAIRQEFVAI